MESRIVHQSKTIMPNGNILVCTSRQTGFRCATPIFWNLYDIEWWGNCDPEKDGYKKLFWNFYWETKPKREVIARHKMRYIAQTLIPFLCGIVISINLSLLIGGNPFYEASWLKVILAAIAAVISPLVFYSRR